MHRVMSVLMSAIWHVGCNLSLRDAAVMCYSRSEGVTVDKQQQQADWNWHKVDPEHMVTIFTFTGFVEEASECEHGLYEHGHIVVAKETIQNCNLCMLCHLMSYNPTRWR